MTSKTVRTFRKWPLAATVLALAAAGCTREAAAPDAQESATPASEASAVASGTPSPAPVANEEIPEAMRGRWGLTRGDCTSTRGDAKGLMVVATDSLTFYESVAKLGMVEQASADRLAAAFEFSGEGQTWVMDVTLTLGEDGQTLVRRDKGPDAMPEPLTYARCAA